jgi:hypothetical protein
MFRKMCGLLFLSAVSRRQIARRTGRHNWRSARFVRLQRIECTPMEVNDVGLGRRQSWTDRCVRPYVHVMVDLPTDHMEIYRPVKRMSDGQLCIRFEGGMFRCMLGKLFNLMLTPETTRASRSSGRASKSIATICSWPRLTMKGGGMRSGLPRRRCIDV